ncbi:MAG: fructose-specific PTS transporter subunit EIIC [Coriobacteriales bacterium]|nr:fructose-specific PTS transporter subunit EIIC [Coriobacteriales bacterium]
MDERRSTIVVSAVALVIAAAFFVMTVLLLNQSLTVAVDYAENAAKFYALDVSGELSTLMREQFSYANAGQNDDELASLLAREQAGDKSDEVSNSLAPVLSRLVVDKELGTAFVVSAATRECYVSNASHGKLEEDTTQMRWMNSLLTQSSLHTKEMGWLAQASPYLYTTDLLGDGSLRGAIAVRPLVANDKVVGVVGVCVSDLALSRVMDRASSTTERQTVCVTQQGTVLFSTTNVSAQDKSIRDIFPSSADTILNKLPDTVETDLMWEGLNGVMPHNQRLYVTTPLSDFGLYLVVCDTAEHLFEQMRTRDVTLIIGFVVVMIFLLLVVMGIVRWYRKRLFKAATTDELTHLANRRYFVRAYEDLVADGHEREATLAIIDVDFFKQINDTYGHAAGDLALASVAAEVQTMVGERGLAGRWGGDEFIGVICAPRDQALERAHDLVKRVAALELPGDMHLSVSVGVCDVDFSLPLERVLDHADDALYETKAKGRGFVTVWEQGVTAHVQDDSLPRLAPKHQAASVTPQTMGTTDKPAAKPGAMFSSRKRFYRLLMQSLLDAVHHMVPFVAGGGILIAVAFLIDGASVDLNSLSAEARANFGSITPFASNLHDVGAAAFNFMLPIFAAFFARGLAGDDAFMAGFAGGYLASQSASGFMGAICAALVAASVVSLMHGFMGDTAKGIQRVAPVLIYPVFSLLVMYLLMMLVVEPIAAWIDGLLTAFLESLLSGSRVVLGLVCGVMMATDLGGFVNKAAYHFGTASIVSGNTDIMAAVMVAGMVPPCAISLCMLIFKDAFTREQRDQGAVTLFMGLSFITEGAIPYAITDFLAVMPSCIVGSGVAGALSELFGCTLPAPHGGIFVFPVTGGVGLYLMALVAGSLVAAMIMGLILRLRKPRKGQRSGKSA